MPNSNPPDNTQLMVEMAKRQLAKEMPKEYASAKIEPMGMLSKILGEDMTSNAYTTPINGVYYSPVNMQVLGDPTKIADVLAHELTHVRQNNAMSTWEQLKHVLTEGKLPYGQRPNELEAQQTIRDRAAAEHRTSYVGNIFPFDETTSPYPRTDNIMLPKEKKK